MNITQDTIKNFINDLVINSTNPDFKVKKYFTMVRHLGYENEIRTLVPHLHKNVPISEVIFCYINNINCKSTCNECQKETRFQNFFIGYKKYCSIKCALNSSEIKEKKKVTNLDKYGTEYPMQNIKVRSKGQDTMMENYGVKNASQSKKIKEKKKQTMLRNWGVENPSKVKEVQDKKIETNLIKYGARHWMTNHDNLPEFIRDSLDRSYLKITKKYSHLVQPLFIQQEYIGVKNNKKYSWKCIKCEYEWSCSIDAGTAPLCPSCNNLLNGSRHKKEVADFVRPHVRQILTNSRNIIPYGLELDIYLPEYNFAIEYNGLYWHSAEKKGSDYHARKTTLCNKQGIVLFHLFDYEWIMRRKAVETIILNHLNKTKKFNVNKCIVKEVDLEEKNDFLERYHLHGECKSKINLGLYFGNELLSVMCFSKSRNNRDFEWELLRYCSKYNITNGYNKILNQFLSKHTKSIICYQDRRHDLGELRTMGFESFDFVKPKKRVLINEDQEDCIHWDCGKVKYSLK